MSHRFDAASLCIHFIISWPRNAREGASPTQRKRDVLAPDDLHSERKRRMKERGKEAEECQCCFVPFAEFIKPISLFTQLPSRDQLGVA